MAMVDHLSVQTPVGTLSVRVVGEPGLPAALLWHSLFVDDRSWQRVEPALAEDRRLVIVTGPGHGRSTDPGRRYTLEDCAVAAVTVLDALGLQEPVDWVGNAWGGHVGVVFAAVHAQRCRSLVAIGAPISAYPLKDRLRTQALVALYRTTGPQEIVVEAVTKALLSARTRQDDPEALELVRSSFTGADRAGTLNAVESIWLHRPDLTPMLSLVRVPTLFITGTAHPDWSPEQAQDAAGLLPHGSAEAIDGTAYLAALEAPEEVAGLVRRFWASAS